MGDGLMMEIGQLKEDLTQERSARTLAVSMLKENDLKLELKTSHLDQEVSALRETDQKHEARLSQQGEHRSSTHLLQDVVASAAAIFVCGILLVVLTRRRQ